MRRIQSLFKTFLMLIPMTAVPVMAIFGIPQFFPVSASPSARPLPTNANGSFVEHRVGQSEALLVRDVSTGSAPSIDLFEPFEAGSAAKVPNTAGVVANPSATELKQRRIAWRDPLNVTGNSRTEVSLRTTSRSLPSDKTRRDNVSSFSGQAGIPPRAPETPFLSNMQNVGSLNSNSETVKSRGDARTTLSDNAQPNRIDDGRYSRTIGERQVSTAPRSRKKVETLTWKQAVDRLSDLGIRTFRLMPDSGQDGYRFVCLVTSVDDPRISRRFEAESVDPLIAVGDVLAQVENWNLHR